VVRIIDPKLCVRCKGRLWCGLPKCPILEQKKIIAESVPKSTEITAPSPQSAFVGWKGYPKLDVAPIVATRDPETADNPILWKNMSIEDIVSVRTATVRPTLQLSPESARDPDERLLTVQEIVMAKRPVDVDALLLKPPKRKVDFGLNVAPMGPRAPAKRIELQENPRTDRLLEKTYYDEIKAEEAIWQLYQRGYDVYTLSKAMTVGIFGIPRNRRLVPTRWAITATDDIIYRRTLREILQFPQINDVLLFQSHAFDNHFYIILFPEAWGFELLEAWAPGSAWLPSGKTVILNDWEDQRGRKAYADNVGGSYYAARMAVIEYLRRERRQARAVILREVHEGYYVPLGVWQVRENVRDALKKNPERFGSIKEALEAISGKLRIPLHRWVNRSVLLRRAMNQRKITDWF